MTQTLVSLLLIMIAATLAPIVVSVIPRVHIPSVIVEIALGIVIGPQLLGWVHMNQILAALSDLGLAFLFFLAGFEIDLNRIKGRPLTLGGLGWVISLVIAFAIAIPLTITGTLQAPEFVALAMATTTKGTLIPILRDTGEMTSRFGAFVLGAGVVGEFGPIVVIAVVLDQVRKPLFSAIILDLFILGVVAMIVVARKWRPAHIERLLSATMHSSAQLAIRITIVILLIFIFAAVRLGLEFLLGAFAAGAVVAQFVRQWEGPREDDLKALETKYEGIGFGLLIPIFFVVSGVTFDLHALENAPIALLIVPVFLLLFLLVRGLPVMILYRRDLSAAERWPLALFCATQLPLVITITDLGVADHKMTELLATCMVAAAMLSVLVFPVIAATQRARYKSDRLRSHLKA